MRHGLQVLVAALLLAACQAPATEAAPAGTPQAPLPLEVTLDQNRRDLGTRLIQVKVGNEGTEPLVIEEVGLETAGFEPAEPGAQDVVLQPGIRVDLPLTLGEGRCDGETTPSAGEPVVLLRVRPESAQPRDVQETVEDDWVLDDLLDRECSRRAIEEAVDLRFGPTWTLEGETLRGTLEVERLDSDEPLTVTGVRGSVLFTVRPAPGRPDPPLVLDPGVDRGELPIEATMARCDGHALGEVKRAYSLELWVRLGDDAERYTTVETDDAGSERWRELTRVGCNLSG